MIKKDKIQLINSLKRAIEKTDTMFDDGEYSKAYIVGYLQGTIKGAIDDLENSIAMGDTKRKIAKVTTKG